MKVDELKDKTKEQLQSSLTDLKKEAFNLRFQKANGQLENTARVRIVRRSVARVMTLINQKSEKNKEEIELNNAKANLKSEENLMSDKLVYVKA